VVGILPLNLQIAKAQNVIDPADILRVNSPAANSTVRGSVEIKFVAFDNQQTTLPVRIQILDGNCSAKRGTLLDASFPSSASERVVSWNTVKAYLDAGPVGDGNVCVSVCSEYKYGQTDYNACNRRVVRVRNVTNQNPVIRSQPVISVNEGQGYSYSVNATDADGDPLTYVLVQKPGFLSIQGNRVVAANATPAGKYQVTLEVRDTFGGSTRQSYTLEVKSVVPAPVQPGPAAPVKQVEFAVTSPLEKSVFTKGSATIQWSLPNSTGVKSLSIDYALAGQDNWTLITRITDKAAIESGKYNWDVANVPAGDYRLRFRIEFDDSSTVQENISPVFSVDKGDIPPVTNEDRISISSLKPAAGLTVLETSPVLGARITTKDIELKQDRVKLKLDGNDVSGCSLTDIASFVWSLECPSANLQPGSHELELRVLDDQGNLIADGGSRSWTFTIASASSDGGTPEEPGQNVFGIIAVILGLLLCLLLLPLLLLGVWRNRTRSYTVSKTKKTTTTAAVPGVAIDTTSNSITGDTFRDYAISTQVDPYDPFTSVATTESSYIAPQPLVAAPQPVAPSQSAPVQVNPPLPRQTQVTQQVTTTVQEPLAVSQPANTFEPIETTVIDKKVEASTTSTYSTPSTADILSGSAAEPMPTVTNELPLADSFQQTTTTSTVTTQAQDEDLPDWLKEDPAESAQVAGATPANRKLEEEEDGSDPYGLGDQSI